MLQGKLLNLTLLSQDSKKWLKALSSFILKPLSFFDDIERDKSVVGTKGQTLHECVSILWATLCILQGQSLNRLVLIYHLSDKIHQFSTIVHSCILQVFER